MHHVLESSVGTGLVFILVSYKLNKIIKIDNDDTHLRQCVVCVFVFIILLEIPL